MKLEVTMKQSLSGLYNYLFMRITDVKKVLTTTSIMKDIFKIDRLTNKNALPLSRSGSKSALHRFV